MLILKSISPHSTIYCPNSKDEKLIGIVTPLSKSQIGCQSQAKKFNEIEQNQSLVQEGQNISGTQKLIRHLRISKLLQAAKAVVERKARWCNKMAQVQRLRKDTVATISFQNISQNQVTQESTNVNVSATHIQNPLNIIR